MVSRLTRLTVITGMFIALAVGMGYALAQFPNVELITCIAFISGLLLNWKAGALVGGVSIFIYSLFNPYGVPFPPVLLMQISGMAFAGVAGGLLQARIVIPPGRKHLFVLGGAGFMLTLIYDILTTLGTVVALSPAGSGGFWPAFAAAGAIGTVFYATHLLSNVLVFTVFIPILLRALSTHHFFRSLSVSQNSVDAVP